MPHSDNTQDDLVHSESRLAHRKSRLAHHILANEKMLKGNGSLGRYFLLPGSSQRAKLISSLFDEVTLKIETPRHHDTYLGTITNSANQKIDVGVVSTGMGVSSTEIIVSELIECGVKRFLRVGTSGAVIDKPLEPGHFVIATGAVRDEGATSHYVPMEYPAIADHDFVYALEQASRKLKLTNRTFSGIIHSKSTLFARAKMAGPMTKEHERYKEIMRSANVLSSEMEASMLFILADVHKKKVISLADKGKHADSVIKAAAVLGIIGSETGWISKKAVREIELETCKLALESIYHLHELECQK